MQQLENVLIEINGPVYKVTINRPDVRNALDAQTLSEIESSVKDAESKSEVRVILITGAGEKVFAAGADIGQLKERTLTESLQTGMQGVFKTIQNSSKVTVAIVKGFALGGGCELAMSCDIRVATENAKFGLPELNLGIIPGAGGTQLLSRMVGKGRALDMILTGKIIDGEEAERIGLASYFIEQEQLDERITDLVEKIISKGPLAAELVKKIVNQGYDIDIDTALWMEKLTQAVVFSTEDKNEGVTAFLEKRSAEFKSK